MPPEVNLRGGIQQKKKKAKITQLMEEKGKSFEEAMNMVEDVYSESDSDSESD